MELLELFARVLCTKAVCKLIDLVGGMERIQFIWKRPGRDYYTHCHSLFDSYMAITYLTNLRHLRYYGVCRSGAVPVCLSI